MKKVEKQAFRLDRQRLGVLGEETAAASYREDGYDILDANYHCRFGELDLVAYNGKHLVFIEVRTREVGSLVSPAETVDGKKQHKLVLTAQHYLLQNPELQDLNMRFDVVEVFYSGGYNCTVNRIENAFTL